jgi:hypothetical protein
MTPSHYFCVEKKNNNNVVVVVVVVVVVSLWNLHWPDYVKQNGGSHFLIDMTQYT